MGYKLVGYFENWAQYRQAGGKFLPAQINPSLFTHINFAFPSLASSPGAWIPPPLEPEINVTRVTLPSNLWSGTINPSSTRRFRN
jgi:chitinase